LAELVDEKDAYFLIHYLNIANL